MRSVVACGVIAGIGVCIGLTEVAYASTRLATSHASASVTLLRLNSTSLISGMAFGRLDTNAAHSPGGTVKVSSAPPTTVTSVGAQLVGGGSTPSPAIYSIKGEPSRAYVVTFPSPNVLSSPGGYEVSSFTLWSANSGTITSRGLGHLSTAGTDSLRVGATITMPGGVNPTNFTAVVPITISYQ